MADIMSSKPQQTSMQKSAVLSRPPLGSREKNLVMQQTVTGINYIVSSACIHVHYESISVMYVWTVYLQFGYIKPCIYTHLEWHCFVLAHFRPVASTAIRIVHHQQLTVNHTKLYSAGKGKFFFIFLVKACCLLS